MVVNENLVYTHSVDLLNTLLQSDMYTNNILLNIMNVLHAV